MGDWPNEQGLSARHLVRACEDSLRRLQTDRIDLYQMHHISRETPWEEIWQAMETLVAQGKILYVGSSNFAGWHLARAQESASRRHFLGLVSEQCIYNLMTRHVELEVVPAAQHYGIGIIPWSPLHGGLLSGAIRKQAEGAGARSTEGRSADALAEHRPTIEAYEKLCAELGHDPANVALGWLLSRPGVTAPIIGPRTVGQLDGALGALDVALDDGTLNRLDELFPPVGTGGPAPEAWAW
jgi:NDP-hexose 2,3-enoyl reductase